MWTKSVDIFPRLSKRVNPASKRALSLLCIFFLLVLNPIEAQFGVEDFKKKFKEFHEVIQEKFIDHIDFTNLEEVRNLASFEDLSEYLVDDFDLEWIDTSVKTFMKYCQAYDINNNPGSANSLIETLNDKGNGSSRSLPPCFEKYYNTQNVLLGSLIECGMTVKSYRECTVDFLFASAVNHANYLHCMSGY